MRRESTPYTLNATESEAQIAIKTVARFAKSLVFNPESDERLGSVSV